VSKRDLQDSDVYLSEGEAWVPDGAALCERFGGLYLYRTLEEGALFMGIPGKGEVSVDSLLLNEGKPSLAIVK
jgi:hypothetical protein